MIKLLFISILLLPLSVYAAEYMPFPKEEITIEEWEAYYQEVKEDFGGTEQAYPERNLVTYSDDQTRMNFAFTMEGHPAHPSWITRQIVQENKTINMQQIGYFAGNEKAFAILFQQYARLTEQVKKRFQNGGARSTRESRGQST